MKDVVILKMDVISTALDNSAFVYVQQEDGTMAQQPITVGVSNGNYVEIKEGLADGDTVYVVAKKEESETGLFAGLFGTTQVNAPAGGFPGGGGGGSGSGFPNFGGGGNGGSGRPSGFGGGSGR